MTTFLIYLPGLIPVYWFLMHFIDPGGSSLILRFYIEKGARKRCQAENVDFVCFGRKRGTVEREIIFFKKKLKNN